MDYFIGAIEKYATFSGRTTRKEFWMFMLVNLILSAFLAMLSVILGTTIFSVIYNLAIFIPCISISARRLHDTGRSGWWQLITFVPLIGVIVLLVFLVQDSAGNNAYGANPKAA